LGSLPGIQHPQAIRAFQKAGFHIARQGKHIIMSDGAHTLVIPRNNPINAFTMEAIIKGSGLTIEQFRALL
jgi:predicted RNA binding protein YcfA (HicA-like mRNA interferase family)